LDPGIGELGKEGGGSKVKIRLKTKNGGKGTQKRPGQINKHSEGTIRRGVVRTEAEGKPAETGVRKRRKTFWIKKKGEKGGQSKRCTSVENRKIKKNSERGYWEDGNEEPHVLGRDLAARTEKFEKKKRIGKEKRKKKRDHLSSSSRWKGKKGTRKKKGHIQKQGGRGKRT